jgi:hypothetical protein
MKEFTAYLEAKDLAAITIEGYIECIDKFLDVF